MFTVAPEPMQMASRMSERSMPSSVTGTCVGAGSGSRAEGSWSGSPARLVFGNEAPRDGSTHQAAEDQPEGRACEAEINRPGQCPVLTHEGSPGDRGAVASREGNAAGEQAIAWIPVEEGRHEHAAGVLGEQEPECDQQQNGERSTASNELRELSGEADRTEKDQQQGVAHFQIEAHMHVGEDRKQCDGHAANQAARDRRGDVVLRKERQFSFHEIPEPQYEDAQAQYADRIQGELGHVGITPTRVPRQECGR